MILRALIGAQGSPIVCSKARFGGLFSLTGSAAINTICSPGLIWVEEIKDSSMMDNMLSIVEAIGIRNGVTPQAIDNRE